MIREMQKKIKSVIHSHYERYIMMNYKDTDKSVSVLWNLLICSIMSLFCLDSGLPKVLSFFLFALVFFIFLNLFMLFIRFILKPFQKRGLKVSLYLFTLFFMCMGILYLSSSTVQIGFLILVAFLFVAVEMIFGQSLYAFIVHKRKSKFLIGTIAVTVIVNVLFLSFLSSKGYEDDYVSIYLGTSKDELNVTPQITEGNYQVESLEYGNGEASVLTAGTVDLTSFLNGYTGMTKSLRDLYWGYSANEVPIKGKVFYPTDKGTYPVVFIIHGNHTLTAPSYLGYDYLAEYISKFGYVVVSVDENFLNAYIDMGLQNENDARAVLLLENIKQFETYNVDKSSPIYQKMDYSNIALIGHSRGGEAVSIAAEFNQLGAYPDNGNILWDYFYHINTVIAIAPTADMYNPAQHDVKLQDINYLYIQGMNDQDVVSSFGYKQYQNVTFRGEKDCFKAYLYIAGANHGKFNTEWGTYDLYAPMKWFLNVKNLISTKKQEDTLKVTVREFLNACIMDNQDSKNFFMNKESVTNELPTNLYVQGYQSSDFLTVCDYDEDINLCSTSISGGKINAVGFEQWQERNVKIEDSTISSYDMNDNCVYLQWTDSYDSTYSISGLSIDATNGVFQFDVADMKDKIYTKDTYQNLDFEIALIDSKGNEISTNIDSYATVYRTLPIQIYKLEFLSGNYDYKHYLQTVRIDINKLANGNQEFLTTNISEIQFRLNGENSGKVILDNIGFDFY